MESKLQYIVFYSDIKIEDYFIAKSLFTKIHLLPPFFDSSSKRAWYDTIVAQYGENFHEGFQIVFFGFESGWASLAEELKKNFVNLSIKVIWNYSDAILYEKFVREHFFSVLSLSKKGVIDKIAFFRKSQFEVYSRLGYNSSYILENYSESKEISSNSVNRKSLGFFPLDNRWVRNIYNQLSVINFLNDDFTLNCNFIDEKMSDFLETFSINSKLCVITRENIKEIVASSSVNIDCSFSDCYHLIFLMSAEFGIPCIIGNTEEFIPKELSDILIVSAEDEPGYIAQKIKGLTENRAEIICQLTEWKKGYDQKSEESIIKFMNE